MNCIDIRELKERFPLSILLPEFGFPPPRSSHNYRSRCLFHGGNNPTSFSANLDKNTWCCFSCGRHGDQITFLMEALDRDFRTVIEWMADRVGISLKKRGRSKTQKKRWDERQKKLQEIEADRQIWKELYLLLTDRFQDQLKKLYQKPRSEWDCKDYLRDHVIEHNFEEADEKRRKMDKFFDKEKKRCLQMKK